MTGTKPSTRVAELPIRWLRDHMHEALTIYGLAMGYDASVIRYDASDLMPKEVGSGTFWTEMVKWISGDSSQTTADSIEKSWPQ